MGNAEGVGERRILPRTAQTAYYNEKLKLVQKRLANLLYDCYDEILKSRNGKTGVSHGFNRNCSLFTGSLRHYKKRYVFNIDLKDFFPSINFGRVRGYFINKNDKNNSILQLEGMLNHIYNIKRNYDKQVTSKRYYNPNAITSLYRRFLFFKHFIDMDKPIIFTEGKSDIIYLSNQNYFAMSLP